jgi:hypothetical protein
MKATRLTFVGIGICLVLVAGCATSSAPGRGGQLVSAQFLYRSSGFVDFESFCSLLLVVEKAGSTDGGTYRLAATLMYNDLPPDDSLLIRAGREAVTLLDEHPRTIRKPIGGPRFATRLSFDLDEELVRKLAGAQRIVFQYGGERITLTDRERDILQSFLADAPELG